MADDDVIEDRKVWRRCNPAVPARISMEYLEREFAALGRKRFARERLGKSSWPSGEPGEWQVISETDWAACLALGDEWLAGYNLGANMGPPPATARTPTPDDWEKWPDGRPPWVRHMTGWPSRIGGHPAGLRFVGD